MKDKRKILLKIFMNFIQKEMFSTNLYDNLQKITNYKFNQKESSKKSQYIFKNLRFLCKFRG